jgi:hypothetical protein
MNNNVEFGIDFCRELLYKAMERGSFHDAEMGVFVLIRLPFLFGRFAPPR